RPSKGEGRVEIILPTGGPERAERADEQWRALVKEMKQEAIKELEKTVGKGADLKGIEKELANLEVNRGRVQELAERIQQFIAERTWQAKLYNTPEAIKELAS